MSADTEFIGPPPRAVSGLSWGALVFTPLWLFRNGFWLSTALYIVGAYYFRPLAVAVGILYFLFGTRWSWSKGERWKSYLQFVDTMFVWNFAAFVMIGATCVILTVEYMWGQ